MSKRDSTTVSMTKKDWDVVQKFDELQRTLMKAMSELSNLRGAAKAKERKTLKGHANSYARFLKDPKTSAALTRCFGDENVVTSMRVVLQNFMKKL